MTSTRRVPDATGSSAQPIDDLELEALFAPLATFPVLILAVSGGADSMAMMHLAARWAALNPGAPRKLVVASVDHDLRSASRQEAEWVGEQARAIGLAHEVLVWQGTKPATGIQEAARAARYDLLAEFALRHASAGPVAVVTAHTEDDQAETFLMRLARGSGLDGLTGMSEERRMGLGRACRLVRPLLGVSRARLEATLKAGGWIWIEDPSNDSDRFERVRLRKARAHFEALGLTNAMIALSAKRLERSRAALEAAAHELEAAAGLDLHGGMFASFASEAFARAAQDVRVRMMIRLVAAFGGQPVAARLAKLETLVGRMGGPAFAAATVGGAIVTRHAGEFRVFREPGRAGLPELQLAPGTRAVWDHRYLVALGDDVKGLVTVRALGGPAFATLRRRLERTGNVPPARAAATLPSFWRHGRLVAVPAFSTVSQGLEIGLCSAEFLW
jgi:tRNA(Ile)-lysidine synthase